MAVELPKLPYAHDALEPYISKSTLEFHHGKHHKAYVDNTNELIAKSDLASKSLEDIVRTAFGKKDTPGGHQPFARQQPRDNHQAEGSIGVLYAGSRASEVQGRAGNERRANVGPLMIESPRQALSVGRRRVV